LSSSLLISEANERWCVTALVNEFWNTNWKYIKYICDLIALFLLSFANCAILHPFFYFEPFCTLYFAPFLDRWTFLCLIAILPPFPSFNDDFEPKHNWQKMGCKIAQEKKKGAKSHNWQKIEGKLQLSQYL